MHALCDLLDDDLERIGEVTNAIIRECRELEKDFTEINYCSNLTNVKKQLAVLRDGVDSVRYNVGLGKILYKHYMDNPNDYD